MALVFALLAGCRGARELPPPTSSDLIRPASTSTAVYSLNLASMLALAHVELETREIDFRKVEDDSILGPGWSLEPTLGKAWGTDRSSELDFEVVPPRPLSLEIRCAPFHFSGSPRQHLSVSVNGRPVGELRLWKMMRSYTVEIPAEVLKFGLNRLELGYAYAAVPAESVPDSTDTRRLAVLYESLRFVDAAPVEPPSTTGDATRLEIPFGAQVSFFVELGSNSALRLASVVPVGAGGENVAPWRLHFEAALDGSDEVSTLELAPTQLGAPLELVLPARRTGQRTRITLAAYSALTEPTATGLLLDLPELISADRELAARLAARDEARRARPSAPVRRPNVLIYLIDTLRADHLGIYGYDRPTSPEIDAFARRSTLFRHAVAQSSWTKPSVASVLTGLNPQLHGVNDRKDALADDATTMAEYLWEQGGYETAAIFTNGNLAHMGLGQGYAHYQHLRETTDRNIHVLSDRLHDEAIHWLDRRDRSKPFFLYLHATDPHAPYTPTQSWIDSIGATVHDPDAGVIEKVRQLERDEVDKTTLADLVALYDAEIAFTDHQFGRLLDELERRGLYDGTLIILLSDHGEEFFDHGWWQHGKTLYQEQLAVPLVIHFPGGRGAGREIDSLVQHIDILPTVLDLAGIEWPADLPGRTLVPLVDRAAARRPPVHAISYLDLDNRIAESVTTADGKLILHHYDPTRRRLLFDLRSDPREKHDLYEERPVLAGYLLSTLRAFDLAHQARHAPEKGEFDPELTERLKTLGYLN